MPLHVLYTIPWLPTATMPHPWARAFDANIVEWAVAAAAAVISPALKLCGLLGRSDWGEGLQKWVVTRVTAAANRISTPLLDHTAWWVQPGGGVWGGGGGGMSWSCKGPQQ